MQMIFCWLHQLRLLCVNYLWFATLMPQNTILRSMQINQSSKVHGLCSKHSMLNEPCLEGLHIWDRRKSKIKLFKSYCSSIFGSELWSLDVSDIVVLCCVEERFETGYESAFCYSLLSTTFIVLYFAKYMTKFANVLRVLFCPVCFHSHHWCILLPVMVCGMAAKYDSVIGHNALLCCKRFDWLFSDFTSGKLSLCNTNFGTFQAFIIWV